MAAPSVDSNGDRIKSDILVSGYVNELMREDKIQVPDAIVTMIFMFWFIDVCS